MRLVEAFRYANYLSSKMDEVKMALMDPTFTMDRSVTHRMGGAVPNRQDYTEPAEKNPMYDFFDPDLAVSFLLALFEEKKNLMYAVAHAKFPTSDAEIALNKDRRAIGVLLSNLGSQRESVTNKGEEYTFGIGADGEQKVYRYKTETVSNIRFSKALAKAAGKEMIRQADESSTDLDEEKLTVEVNFHPQFDISDTLEEAFNKYKENQKE